MSLGISLNISFSPDLNHFLALALALALAQALALAVPLALALTVSLGLALALAVSLALVLALAVPLALSLCLAVPLALALALDVSLALAVPLALSLAIPLVLVSGQGGSTHTFFASSSGHPDEACTQSGDCARPSEWRFWHRLAGRYKAQQVIERQRFLGRLQQQFLPGVEPPHASNDLIMGNISMENSRKTEKVRFEDGVTFSDEAVCRFEPNLADKTAISSCFRGTLTYQLRYDFIHRVLMLHVRRANNLPGTDGPPDPYVKMYCLPERRNHWKTSILKKSVDPEFNEMFSFDIPYNELAHRMLQFTVYDFDRFTRHGLIGNVIMRDLFEKSDLYNWTEFTMPIVGSQEKNDFGDLLLYLAYSADLCKLYLTVAKAYNLRPMDITGASDPYVKCEQIYQKKRVKMRKTSIKRANLNPVYHECLEFDLPVSQIRDTNILVQVMDWDRIGRDDLLGCCVLGNESPTPEGRTQWMQCFTLVYGNNLPQAASSEQLQTLTNGETRLPLDSRLAIDNRLPLDSYDPENGTIKENGQTELEPNGMSLRELRGKYSVASLGSNGNPIGMQCFDAALRPIGTWHSILGEVPDNFRNIPKAKRK
ncbi:unnamed protein product [Bursaphelenchus okinawaensis]|uniref:C2 domain-containing protein n=1 Tax=Bursaphelenchus okinawaensis TaxID=465554 RepID=A0A811LDN3_9BILA|nr:unnamed protein product [Bursaphelenchus okinawaensis]CAG9121308.1 unnamed protein product [Bursaphelenchus okinawaensis]